MIETALQVDPVGVIHELGLDGAEQFIAHRSSHAINMTDLTEGTGVALDLAGPWDSNFAVLLDPQLGG